VLVVEPDEEGVEEAHQFCVIHYPKLVNISVDAQTAVRWPLAILKVRE
jgi:hypothetical protein